MWRQPLGEARETTRSHLARDREKAALRDVELALAAKTAAATASYEEQTTVGDGPDRLLEAAEARGLVLRRLGSRCDGRQ